MACLANPFAYIGMNTLIALMPGIAQRLELSATLAGFWVCFGVSPDSGLLSASGSAWLALSFSLAAGRLPRPGRLLHHPSCSPPTCRCWSPCRWSSAERLAWSYYSSLFYSMDSSETKGAHGGIHEWVIWPGHLAGPAVGAAAPQFLPQYSHSGTAGRHPLAALWAGRPGGHLVVGKGLVIAAVSVAPALNDRCFTFITLGVRRPSGPPQRRCFLLPLFAGRGLAGSSARSSTESAASLNRF